MNFKQFFTSQTWWGKILGAFFGHQMAGPFGAFLGILIGNFFDRGLASHFSSPHWHYHAEKRQAVQKIFFQTTFSVMGHIAKADGRVSENEIALALRLMDEMRLNSEQKARARALFNEGKQRQFDLSNALATLKNACHDNPDLLKLFMDIQYRAAMADGLSQAKMDTLNTLFLRLGFAPLHQQYRFYEDFGAEAFRSHAQGEHARQHHHQRNTYQSRPHDALAMAYALLEVPQSASKPEVKQAYRRLISRNHPDKLIAQGLPEEMIKMANDKTQKITKAYDLICTSKGW